MGSTPAAPAIMATKEWIKNNQDRVRKYRRDWYARNTTHAKSKVVERRKRNRQWLKDYKSQLECRLCGESHPACLDFHHLDPEEKEVNVGLMLGKGWSVERMLREIKKCVVLCSNCHRKHHWGKEWSSLES